MNKNLYFTSYITSYVFVREDSVLMKIHAVYVKINIVLDILPKILSLSLCLSVCLSLSTFIFYESRGWSGGAMVLGKLPVPGRPTYLD